MTTTTSVVGLRQNKAKPGRDATGMVALEMRTTNQDGVCVMHYWRCPMIPCRDPGADTGRADDFDWIPEALADAQLRSAAPTHWQLAALAPAEFPVPAPVLAVGDSVRIEAQDTITCAPELVRMTGNIAFAHTDASRSYLGKRLVYGGHTISLAFAQITRALPHMISLIGWQGCDHLGPVLEEDIIRSAFSVTRALDLEQGGRLLELHLKTDARRATAAGGELEDSQVLDWRLVVWTL